MKKEKNNRILLSAFYHFILTLMGCEAISVHWTAGILWFWHLLMVIFSIMMKEGLIVVELHNMPNHASVPYLCHSVLVPLVLVL